MSRKQCISENFTKENNAYFLTRNMIVPCGTNAQQLVYTYYSSSSLCEAVIYADVTLLKLSAIK